jgi:cell division septation protein DedD
MAVAAVLRRKGFHAHAVPKPGDGTLYRVIVGPIRDAGELSSTRDLLRKTGFGQVIVQHYE